MRLLSITALGVSLLAASSAGRAEQQDLEGIAYFEKHIRPLFIKHCYSCHSAKAEKLKGGLRLDGRDGIMSGGDTGPALIAGEPDDSLLFTAVQYDDPDLQMPPKYRLSDDEIASISRWITMGAPDPRVEMAPVKKERVIDIEAGRKFWSFRPVAAPPVPDVKNHSWADDDLDRFILARLERNSLQPAAEADRETLLRRATFDLTGLPPTPEEIESFLKDTSDDAFAKVVDRLLKSPAFGERWGRHWLDVARYAESMGRTRNYTFPFAWRYRDYAIKSFNEDKPYDRFIREQIAGDLLKGLDGDARIDALTGTGFLAIGSHDLNERNAEKFRMDVADEQIDTMSRAFLGLTLSCARCHDHKFDPVPTADYYALAGIFRSTHTLNGFKGRARGGNKNYFQKDRFHALGTDTNAEAVEARFAKQIEAAEQRLKEKRAELKRLQKTKSKKEVSAARKELKKFTGEVQQLKRGGPKRTDLAMGVSDGDTPADVKVHIRGETTNLGDSVPRGFVQVLLTGEPIALDPRGSGRLELAEWLTRGDHPLTARVMVNRVWHHLFGRGIVRTVDNFGATGEPPTHPELLDHLATGFIKNGWSVKGLIRRVMLSRAYRMSSDHQSANYDADPDNRLFWRTNPRRLEVEALRDSMLAVAGTLDRTPPHASPVLALGGKQVGGKVASPGARGSRHRTIYQPILRGYVPPMMETFDFADPSQVIGRRDVTTVATQALFMMNNRFVVDQSQNAAKRLLAKDLPDDAARVAEAYRRTFGRAPTDEESARALEYVTTHSASGQTDAWKDLYHALFASAEFRYVR